MPTIYGVPYRRVLSTLSLGEPNTISNDGGFLWTNIGFDLDPVATTDLINLTIRPNRIFIRDAAGPDFPDFTREFQANGYARFTGPGSVGSIVVPLDIFTSGGRWRTQDGGIDGYNDWVARFLALEAGSRSLDIDFFASDLSLDLGLNPPLTLKEYADLSTGLPLHLGLDQPLAYKGTVRYAELDIVTSETSTVSTFPSVTTPTIAVYWGRSVGDFGFNSFEILGSSNQFRFRNLRGSQAWNDNGDIIISSSSSSAVFPSPSADGTVIYDVADYPDATQLLADLLAGSNPTTVDFRTNIVTPIAFGLELGTSTPEVATPTVEAGTLALALAAGAPNGYTKRAAGTLALELGFLENPETISGQPTAPLGLDLGTGTPNAYIRHPAGELALEFPTEPVNAYRKGAAGTLGLSVGLSAPESRLKSVAAETLALELGVGAPEGTVGNIGVPRRALGLDLGQGTPIGYTGTAREADFGSGVQETAATLTISEDDSDIDPDIDTFYFEYNGFNLGGFSANLYSLFFDGVSFDLFLSTYPATWEDSRVSVTIRNAHGDEVTQSNISDATTISFSEDSTPGYTDFVRNLIGGTNYDLTVTFAYGSGSANALGLVLSSPPVNHETRYGTPQEAILELGVSTPSIVPPSVVAGTLSLDLGVGTPESRLAYLRAHAASFTVTATNPQAFIANDGQAVEFQVDTTRPNAYVKRGAGTLSLTLSTSAPQVRLSSMAATPITASFQTTRPTGFTKHSATPNTVRYRAGTPDGRLASVSALPSTFKISTSDPIAQGAPIHASPVTFTVEARQAESRLGNLTAKGVDFSVASGQPTRVPYGYALPNALTISSGRPESFLGKMTAKGVKVQYQTTQPESFFGSLPSTSAEFRVSTGMATGIATSTFMEFVVTTGQPEGRLGSVAGGPVKADYSAGTPDSRLASYAARPIEFKASTGRANGILLTVGSNPVTFTITAEIPRGVVLKTVKEVGFKVTSGHPEMIRGQVDIERVQNTDRGVRDSAFVRNYSARVVEPQVNQG